MDEEERMNTYPRGPENRGGVGGGCLTYIFTGRVGNCVMLPFWRAIGNLFNSLFNGFV